MTATDATTTYDVHELRRAFPGVDPDLARFDGPGGSLVPEVVADAVAGMLRAGVCQRGGPTAVGRLADDTVLAARAAIARHVGLSDARGVVFGRSMTAVTFDMARTLSRDWGPGDEVVVSRLDHDSNIRPWVVAAERAGATVRWLGFDPVTAELDDVGPLLTDRTRLVAVTAASNLFGTRPDVAGIARAAHEVGALVYVDAVHLAAHVPVDLGALGRGPAGLLAVQVLRPAPGRRRGGPRPPRAAATRQAAALERRRAGALRAGDAALRAAGRRDGGRGVRRGLGDGGRRGRTSGRCWTACSTASTASGGSPSTAVPSGVRPPSW